MTIDMKEIGIIANLSDDMLVPDFGQHRTAGLFQSMSSLCWLLGPQLPPLTAFFCRACVLASTCVYQSIAGRYSARAYAERWSLDRTRSRLGDPIVHFTLNPCSSRSDTVSCRVCRCIG